MLNKKDQIERGDGRSQCGKKYTGIVTEVYLENKMVTVKYTDDEKIEYDVLFTSLELLPVAAVVPEPKPATKPAATLTEPAEPAAAELPGSVYS